MPIISKPREIRITLDPDQGFSVGFSVVNTQHIEEAGQKIAEIGPHTEAIAPDSSLVAGAIQGLNAANAIALMTYQAEVQRLAGELAAATARIAELEAAAAPPA